MILPLIAMTLWRAYKRQRMPHRRISVVTLPLWFYVSVTGVVIYAMLYHLAPALRYPFESAEIGNLPHPTPRPSFAKPGRPGRWKGQRSGFPKLIPRVTFQPPLFYDCGREVTHVTR